MKNNIFEKSIWINAYILVIMIHLYSCFYNIQTIRSYSKVLLMPLLLKIYHNQTKKENRSKLVSIGIFLGFIGDTLLISDGQLCLFLGLISFLSGHLCYIYEIFSRIERKKFKQKIMSFISLTFFISFILIWLYNNYMKEGLIKGQFIIPGVIYLFILGLLNLSSSFYLCVSFNKKTLTLVLGTLLFFISDSTLARSLFYETYIYYTFIIMSTYIAAQTLITYSLLKKEDFIIV